MLIPTYNEALTIGETLRRCVDVPGAETIVVDGGSEDETEKLAADLGAQVYSSPRGRALQMNQAASKAIGEILLFLHADTHLPRKFEEEVESALSCPEVAGGAFRLRIRGDSRSLRLIELGVQIRSRHLGFPYGDQAIFLRARTFQELEGFKEMPIMEDLDLILRLRRMGKIVILRAAVETSPRRWSQLGVLKTTLINQVALAAYLSGISPDRIARFYRREHLLP